MTSELSSPQCRWIVGVDGSDASLHALRWALAHASGRSATVTAIQCWQPLDGRPDDPDLSEQLRDATRSLRRLRSSLGPVGSELLVEVVHGHPVQVLLDRAELADLLILGSRGLGGFERLLLGSVSHHCVTHSKVPVAIIPPTTALDGVLHNIVVGVDGSTNSGAALEWALGFAGKDTAVNAVRVWESSTPATKADLSYFEALAAKLRKDYHGDLEEVLFGSEPGAPFVSRSFHYSQAADALVERGSAADLLVVGRRGRGAVASAILGSVSNAAVRQAPCPVCVVPNRHRLDT